MSVGKKGFTANGYFETQNEGPAYIRMRLDTTSKHAKHLERLRLKTVFLGCLLGQCLVRTRPTRPKAKPLSPGLAFHSYREVGSTTVQKGPVATAN